MRRKSLAEEYPELMCQWHKSNLLSPKEVSSGSHKKVMWICKKGHTWEAVVKNRALLGSGCPYCEHRAVLKGYNDLQTMFPEVAATWSPNNKLKPTEVSSRSNTEALWKCSKGHEWKARVADRTEGHGCPYCAGTLALILAKLRRKLFRVDKQRYSVEDQIKRIGVYYMCIDDLPI